ncbi:helix-turn-helix domain-containing protein [Bacillus cereus]|uniref:helix-turn-helix domain-containing protein n=1 Tax=Bacillus cereus TaxID=1396 RepID=UPI000BFCAF6B|nr:helix-turn-helix transcriptional regulator [Bacillus cereus]PGR83440.1 hypothetical protein COC63_05510 [Bacillus cereus]
MLAEQVVAKRLGELMKKKGVDITDVVEATGLCRGTMTKLTKGIERKVEFTTLDRLATYFGVEVQAFFKGTENKENQFEVRNNFDTSIVDKLKEDEEVREFLRERNYPRDIIDKLVDSQEQVKELIEQRKDMTIRYVQTFIYLLDTTDVAYPNWRIIAKPELEKLKNKINEVLEIKTK